MAVLFDSHAHINIGRRGEAGLADLIAAIESSDVGYVTDIGFDLDSSKLAVAHAEAYPWCYAAVGVHPGDVSPMTEDTIDALRSLASGSVGKVVAIGEIGLDYHYDDGPPADLQRHWFKRQLALGIELGMPVAIHDRDSGGETMETLIGAGAFAAARVDAFRLADGGGGVRADADDGFPDARILLHCFSGNADEALAAVRLGAWISVAGPVTFKNNRTTQEVAGAVPLSRLLIETDAPYLTPVPHRGKTNIPPYVEFTARKIAEIRGVSYDGIAAATTENAKRFYGIA